VLLIGKLLGMIFGHLKKHPKLAISVDPTHLKSEPSVPFVVKSYWFNSNHYTLTPQKIVTRTQSLSEHRNRSNTSRGCDVHLKVQIKVTKKTRWDRIIFPRD